METLGQKRVVLNYGIPTQEQKDLAQNIKLKVAELIDMIEHSKTKEIKLKCAELIDMIEHLKTNGERARIVATAQTEFETACMYSVKAVSNTYESTTI